MPPWRRGHRIARGVPLQRNFNYFLELAVTVRAKTMLRFAANPPLEKASVELVTAQSITAFAQSQCPFIAESRFPLFGNKRAVRVVSSYAPARGVLQIAPRPGTG
jgi:hypothetical protein